MAFESKVLHDLISLDSKRVAWETFRAAPTPLRVTMDAGSSVAAPYRPLAMREIKNKYCWAVFISIIISIISLL